MGLVMGLLLEYHWYFYWNFYFNDRYWVIGPDYNRNYSWGVRSSIQCPGCVQTLPEYGWFYWDGGQHSMVKDPTMKVMADIDYSKLPPK